MTERRWTIDIKASPEAVYDLVAAVDRVPEFSPECRRIEWLDEDHEPTVGARFRGRNRWLGFAWWREVRVTSAERGRTFCFETLPGRGIYNDTTKWRYTFEPTAHGSRVTEAYELFAPNWLRVMNTVIGRPWALRANVRRTLASLKARAETANEPPAHPS